MIKVSRGRSHPEDFSALEQAAREAGVIVVDEVLSRARAYGFIQMCDCFVSLHRAEGFGLCLAEAMLMGKPVIATNYSGNLAFMHPGNSLLVDYTLAEIADDNPIYKTGNHWAEPSIDHAAELNALLLRQPGASGRFGRDRTGGSERETVAQGSRTTDGGTTCNSSGVRGKATGALNKFS